VKIKDDNGSSHEIIQNNHRIGELALGIKFSPSGDTRDEVLYLRGKAEVWAEK
jgi:hypothetical protein